MNFDSGRRILFIDNSLRPDFSPLGNFAPYFRFPFDRVSVLKDTVPVTGKGYSHIILSGSGADFDGEWQSRESRLIEWAHKNDMPLLGVCFGHQLIVKTLYGRERLGEMEQPNYGWHEVEVTADDILLGGKAHVYFAFSHHTWEVKSVPENEVDIIAASVRCPVSGIKIKGKRMWGLQPHFEIGIGTGVNLLRGTLGEADTWNSLKANPPKDSGGIYSIMSAFLNL